MAGSVKIMSGPAAEAVSRNIGDGVVLSAHGTPKAAMSSIGNEGEVESSAAARGGGRDLAPLPDLIDFVPLTVDLDCEHLGPASLAAPLGSVDGAAASWRDASAEVSVVRSLAEEELRNGRRDLVINPIESARGRFRSNARGPQELAQHLVEGNDVVAFLRCDVSVACTHEESSAHP
jgi:hypothetical protein